MNQPHIIDITRDHDDTPAASPVETAIERLLAALPSGRPDDRE